MMDINHGIQFIEAQHRKKTATYHWLRTRDKMRVGDKAS